MIIVKLNGGLGNQLFQYTLGKHLSVLHQAPLKLDISWYKKEIRNYGLQCFAIEADIATDTEISAITRMTTKWYHRLDRNIIQPLLPYYKRRTVVENQSEFDYNILKVTPPVYLSGYWQNELYFKDIEGIIRKDLHFKEPLDGQNRILSEQINQTDSISLHVRRGDYISVPEYKKAFGICSSEYYAKAINQLSEKISRPHFFVFSDDILWVKENIPINFPVTYIDHNTGHSSYRDMQLMSLCKHNIIANSTFSWWGAWLNSNPNKMVIAPGIWSNYHKANSIIPSTWNIIK